MSRPAIHTSLTKVPAVEKSDRCRRHTHSIALRHERNKRAERLFFFPRGALGLRATAGDAHELAGRDFEGIG